MLCVLPGSAHSQEPEQFESLLASAQKAQARGDFESAAELYRKASALRPEIPELKANLGLMYYQTGKDQQAIEAFLQSIRLNRSLFVPNLFLGLDYVKLKRFSEGVPYLKQATLSKPTDIQARLALGQAYAAIGKTRLASASYVRAVQLDARNADSWFHLGVSYLEQIESDARVLSTKYKSSGYLQALAAETLAQQQKFAQADEAYKAALAAPEFPPGTHAGYGFLLLNQQHLPDAEQEFKAELAAFPGSAIAKLGLARLLVEEGSTSAGLSRVDDIWKTQPAFSRSHISFLTAGLRPAKRSELERMLQERQNAGDISPELVTLIRNGGDAAIVADVANDSSTPVPKLPLPSKQPVHASELYASGHYLECNELLAPRLQFLQPIDLELLAACAYSTGSYQNGFRASQRLATRSNFEMRGLYWETKSAEKLASDALLNASQIDSSSPQMHVLLGDVYRQQNNSAAAEQEYRKALALRPGDSGALFGLCLTLLADSRADQALALVQSELDRDPNDPELNALMGETLCARRDFSEAEPYLKKGLNARPELVSHVHALLGKVYAETNRTEQAIAELKLGLPDDKDGQVHYQIGRIYLKLGDRESAKQAFEASEQLRRKKLTGEVALFQQSENDINSQ